MFTNKWDPLYLLASISRILEPNPQDSIFSKNMNSNSSLKNLSPHFDPGNPADCCMFHILISKAAPISRPLIDYLQFQFQAGKNLCLALSRPKSMEHLYDEIIIGSLFPKRKKKDHRESWADKKSERNSKCQWLV